MQYSAACTTCKTFPQGGVAARNDAQASATPTILAHCGRLRGSFWRAGYTKCLVNCCKIIAG